MTESTNAPSEERETAPAPDSSSLKPLMPGIVLGLVALVALAVTYFSGLSFMVSEWFQDEYSHGWLIPAIAGFLVFKQRKALWAEGWRGAWIGVAIVLLGAVFWLMGELSALYVIVQYGFLIALGGLVFSLVGWRGMRYAWAPLVYLAFMIPLPDFLYNNLSAKLQLISSELGVAVIEAFGVSVFLEGNVIDLGNYKLQVVEACNGLRYLFPLMSFGFLLAYLFQAPLWMRAIVFLSTIPITVLMNSFRIGVIGVLVDRWGEGQAEGFLHAFEGWVIFMACLALLALITKLLMVATRDKRSILDAFSLDGGQPMADGALVENSRFHKPFFASVAVVVLTAVASLYIVERQEDIPDRQRFAEFNLDVGEWNGRHVPVEQIYLDSLKLEDYLSAQFERDSDSSSVNTWVAYYATQRKGVAIHSPKTCLPGGGWKIDRFAPHTVDNIGGAAGPVTVNRAVMSQGDQRLLIYYWFKQRERNLKSEYALKWYLFWDSLTRNRTDGALVRLIVGAPASRGVDGLDTVLEDFMRESYDDIVQFVPD